MSENTITIKLDKKKMSDVSDKIMDICEKSGLNPYETYAMLDILHESLGMALEGKVVAGDSGSEIKSLRKNVSKLQADVNRLRKKADDFRRINDDRKEQLTRVSVFMKNLLAEGRVSRAELKAIFPRRKVKFNYERLGIKKNRRSPKKEWKW